jgi:uncharacterized phage protein gp47/JayE
MGTYVKDSGLQRKTLQEIRLELESALKTVFGQDFETSVDSPNGLLIGSLSLSLANIWELAQEVYNSRDPAQATGLSLDFAAALNGLARKEATACRGQAMLYSLNDYSVTIPAGSIALRPRGNQEFSLQEPVTIDPASCDELIIVDEGFARDTDYVFHFAQPIGDLTFNWATGDSRSAVVALSTQISTAGGETDVLENGDLRVFISGGKVGVSTPLPDDCSIYKGALGEFATAPGAQTCEVGELTDIPTTVSGWDRVRNYEAFIPGSDAETDTQLRVRRAAAVRAIQSRATDDAIAAHLMQDVSGVTAASVVSNRAMQVDADGRPPKSFEALVVGGTDQAVAQNIWQNQPSGIQSYGNTSVEISDGEGVGQIVSFSRPQAKYLWVKIEWQRYSEETAPTNDEIKAALLQWAEKEYKMGVDVISMRILQGLYFGTTGIGNATANVAITDSPTDTPVWQGVVSQIPIAPSNYAVLAADRITIIEDT